MTYRMRNIGIAIALALVAGLLTVFYVTNYKRDVRNAESNVIVYVAARDIPAGTSGEEIASEGYMKEQEFAKRSVTPGAISDPAQIGDRVSSGVIYAGEQVTTRRFTTEEQKGIRAQLTGNKRALEVAGEPPQLLAGTLKEGDRVDVVGNWNAPEQKTQHYSRVVLRDVPVLKAPATTSVDEKVANPDQPGLSVILELTDAQAQKLFWLMQNGAWALQLRPTSDAADSPESAESAETLLLDGMNFNQLRAVASAGRLLQEGGR
jgi:Flp pilus assembly protein CpaB